MNGHHHGGHDGLHERARRAGIALQYASFWGEHRDVLPEVLERALSAMGSHADASALPEPIVMEEGQPAEIAWHAAASWRLVTSEVEAEETACEGQGPVARLPATLRAGYYRLVGPGTQEERFVIVAPARCWSPEPLRHGERWWGLSVQLYSLRSDRNWGIGDFSDLCDLVATAAAQGAAFVGLSPLHALRMDRPDLASPYSPSSRLALNPLFIDVTAMPEFLRSSAAQALYADGVFQQRLQALRAAETVQYAEVAAAKEEMLALLWDEFRQGDWESLSPRGLAFQAFMKEHAATLAPHALFEAIQRHLVRTSPGTWGWPAWPEELQDPQGPAAQAFAKEHAEAVAYHMWLQWTAHLQARAGRRSRPRTHAARAVLRPGRRRERRRLGNLDPAEAVCARHERGGPARSAEHPGPGLGPAAAQPRRAGRSPLHACAPPAACRHAPRRGAAHGPCDGAHAPFLDPWRRRHLRRLSAAGAARGPRRRKPSPPVPGHRRRPGQRGAADARGHGAAHRAVLSPADFRAHGWRSLPATRAMAGTGPGRGEHARPAHAARILVR